MNFMFTNFGPGSVHPRVSSVANLAHKLFTHRWKSPAKVARQLERETLADLPANSSLILTRELSASWSLQPNSKAIITDQAVYINVGRQSPWDVEFNDRPPAMVSRRLPHSKPRIRVSCALHAQRVRRRMLGLFTSKRPRHLPAGDHQVALLQMPRGALR